MNVEATVAVASPLTASVFVIPIEPDRCLIYAPLRRVAFVGDAAMVRTLEALQAGQLPESAAVVDWLRDLRFLDGGPEPEPEGACSGPPRHTAVTLMLTSACNLRCRYCYASAGDTPAEWMPLDLARRAIDYVVETAWGRGDSAVEVSYHGGGEPTLHWDVLVESWNHASRRAAEHGTDLTGAIATNGVLDEKKAAWIAGHLDSASVSLDGSPEIHDRQRPDTAGAGSSSLVLATLQQFDAAGFEYGIRLTVTAESAVRLCESLEFLCANTAARDFQAEPVYAMGRGCFSSSAETDIFIREFTAARRIAGAHGRRLTFSAARPGLRTTCFCGVSRDNFVVLPSGRISACHEAFSDRVPHAGTFHYGRIGETIEIDTECLDRLRRLDVGRKPYCHGCFARWDCAGDCHYKWMHAAGGGEFDGSARCRITQALIVDDLLGRIAASGGWLWREESE